MNIILIGFMGAGKTVVARLLAKKLKFKVIEMDDLVLASSRRKSINQIFQKDGEIRFRELEIGTAKKLSNVDSVVISTGGGVVMNKIILDYLKQKGLVFFLQASFETIRERLKDDAIRPLFQDKKSASQLYKFRLPFYKKYADFKILTEGKSVNQVAQEVLDKLKKYENLGKN